MWCELIYKHALLIFLAQTRYRLFYYAIVQWISCWCRYISLWFI